jgi:hypothetical protein
MTDHTCTPTDREDCPGCEERRQYEEAKRFLVLCPDFNPKDDALCNQLIDEVEARGITMSAEALASAWCQYKGVPDPFEPKVMTAEAIHNKFKAIDFAPPQDVQFMDLGDVKWKWKPMSTGLKGATTVSTGDMMSLFESTVNSQDWIHDLANDMVQLAAQEWGDAVVPPEPEKKPVAAMPTSWYAGDVVEINTGRRIKDDD